MRSMTRAIVMAVVRTSMVVGVVGWISFIAGVGAVHVCPKCLKKTFYVFKSIWYVLFDGE
jgi:hypothetical protein